MQGALGVVMFCHEMVMVAAMPATIAPSFAEAWLEEKRPTIVSGA
jgi:hypothetical protein